MRSASSSTTCGLRATPSCWRPGGSWYGRTSGRAIRSASPGGASSSPPPAPRWGFFRASPWGGGGGGGGGGVVVDAVGIAQAPVGLPVAPEGRGGGAGAGVPPPAAPGLWRGAADQRQGGGADQRQGGAAHGAETDGHTLRIYEARVGAATCEAALHG